MLITATPADASTRLEQIARLNDRARLGFDRTARTVITRNCLERLGEADGAPKEPILLQAQLMAAFRHCTFSADSPERDFAVIEFLGHKVWLKVDLYEDPDVKSANDPTAITRVITIMLPSDY